MYADILELAVIALARIMRADIHSQNGPAILAQACLCVAEEKSLEPAHPHLRMADPDLTASPPSEIPDLLKEGIERLSSPLRNLLMSKAVPYLIQHRLGMEKYTSVEDVADRWDTAQAGRQHGPAAMGFRAGDHGFNAESSAYMQL